MDHNGHEKVEKEDVRRCPNCGALVENGRMFCIECGYVFMESEERKIPGGKKPESKVLIVRRKDKPKIRIIGARREDEGHIYELKVPHRCDSGDEVYAGEDIDVITPEDAVDVSKTERQNSSDEKVDEVLIPEIVKIGKGGRAEVTRLEDARRRISSITPDVSIEGVVCKSCEGTGVIYKEKRCNICGGSGECPECYSLLGYCRYCNGTGLCSECHGTGNCPDCTGGGKCSSCNGTGVCFYCEGSGCEYCNNTGKCTMCAGSATCTHCRGIGACASCNGTGLCNICRGTKECQRCGGNGRCTNCNGEGIVGVIEETCPICNGKGHI